MLRASTQPRRRWLTLGLLHAACAPHEHSQPTLPAPAQASVADTSPTRLSAKRLPEHAPKASPPPSNSLPSAAAPTTGTARSGSLAARDADASPTPPGTAQSKQTAPTPATDWCTQSVKALDEQTCYVLPERRTDELLVYLHGLVPVGRSSVQLTHFEQVVANACERAGVTALIPRGVRNTRGRYAATWGWPSGAAYLREIDALLKRFEQSREKLETLAGQKFTKVYVAGSSAGAYFVTALALRGDFSAAGYAALSGGGSPLPSRLAQLTPKPFYVGYGRFDPAGAEARALERKLRGAHWPVRLEAHPTGHGAREIYLDEAFTFWREHARASTGELAEP